MTVSLKVFNSSDRPFNSFFFLIREKEEHELTYQDNFAPYGLYQRIPTHGAKDFEYFTYNGHHYLVTCNEYTRRVVYTADFRQEYEKDYEIDSVIYWWTGKRLLLLLELGPDPSCFGKFKLTFLTILKG